MRGANDCRMSTATFAAPPPQAAQASDPQEPPRAEFVFEADRLGTAGERIPPDSPLAPYVSVDRGRMGGTPCFVGSRVPIQHLFDHLRAGDTFEVFLEDFPPVTREQIVGVIDLAALGMIAGLKNL